MSQNIRFRIGGLISLIVSVGFGWFFIWQPLQQAQHHVATVQYSIKAFVAVPALAVSGLFLLLFGDTVPYRNVEKKTPTAAGWILFLVIAAASGLSFWWFKAQFAALGYSE